MNIPNLTVSEEEKQIVNQYVKLNSWLEEDFWQTFYLIKLENCNKSNFKQILIESFEILVNGEKDLDLTEEDLIDDDFDNRVWLQSYFKRLDSEIKKLSLTMQKIIYLYYGFGCNKTYSILEISFILKMPYKDVLEQLNIAIKILNGGLFKDNVDYQYMAKRERYSNLDVLNVATCNQYHYSLADYFIDFDICEIESAIGFLSSEEKQIFLKLYDGNFENKSLTKNLNKIDVIMIKRRIIPKLKRVLIQNRALKLYVNDYDTFIYQEMDKLNQKDRFIVISYYRGKKIEEIARLLNISSIEVQKSLNASSQLLYQKILTDEKSYKRY